MRAIVTQEGLLRKLKRSESWFGTLTMVVVNLGFVKTDGSEDPMPTVVPQHMTPYCRRSTI